MPVTRMDGQDEGGTVDGDKETIRQGDRETRADFHLSPSLIVP